MSDDSKLDAILEIVQDTMVQLVELRQKIGDVSAAGYEHLVDVSGLDSYTTTYMMTSERDEFILEPPPRDMYFLPEAICVDARSPDDPDRRVVVTLADAMIAHEPQLAAPIRSDRLWAPPGRGHPIAWKGYSQQAIIRTLVVTFAAPKPALVHVTMSGAGMDTLPPEVYESGLRRSRWSVSGAPRFRKRR